MERLQHRRLEHGGYTRKHFIIITGRKGKWKERKGCEQPTDTATIVHSWHSGADDLAIRSSGVSQNTFIWTLTHLTFITPLTNCSRKYLCQPKNICCSGWATLRCTRRWRGGCCWCTCCASTRPGGSRSPASPSGWRGHRGRHNQDTKVSGE